MKSAVILIACIIYAASGASLDKRTVLGEIAADGQFPYLVSCKVNGNHVAVGTIINERYILTSGARIVGARPGLITVVAGSNRLDEAGDVYRVADMKHNIQWFTGTYNIVLIKLQTEISFNERVQPIALHAGPVPAGADLVVSGWLLERLVSYPTELRFLQLTALSTGECRHRQAGFRTVADTQICAVKTDGAGYCDVGGGNAVVFEGKLAGLASWFQDPGCGREYPEVYTGVSHFITWIQDNMN